MKISHWIHAFRLRTLFLSLSCIWGGIICAEITGATTSMVTLFTFLTALFLQILSNLANDYGDSIHGADHADRKGPARAVQSGAISAANMKTALFLFAALSFLSGCALLYFSFPVIGLKACLSLLGIGVLSIIAAIAYTNGKRPYGYAGLGDISVFIFFGWVAVCGTQYLQTAQISFEAILLSVAFGCLAVGVLNLNNMRDIESDQSAGKKSIPVRLGLNRAKIYHQILLMVALVSFFTFNSVQEKQIFWNIPTLIILSVNMFLVQKAKNYQTFDPLLKWLSISTLLIALIIQISL